MSFVNGGGTYDRSSRRAVPRAHLPPIRPRPPLTREALAQAEARLGFPLPPVLRALYTQVGDGGYGPGRGLEVLAEGEGSLVAYVEAIRHPDCPEWPGQFIPLIAWGCLYRSWVDCSGPPYQVWLYDTDFCGEDGSESDYFYLQADSLEGWLTAWLDGADLWAVGKRRKAAKPDAVIESVTDSVIDNQGK